MLITEASRISFGYVVIQSDVKLEVDASKRNSLKTMPKESLISCGLRYICSAELIYPMVKPELLALQ